MSLIDSARSRLSDFIDGKSTKAKSLEEQTETEKQVVSFVRGRLEEIRSASARIANEGTWLTNTAYLCGFDSVYFDAQTKQFRANHNAGYGVGKSNRVRVNKILPTCQNRLARLIKSPPRYDIRPKSEDEDDKDAARLGKQVLNQQWEALKVNQKRAELVMWLQQAGHSYFKVCWDPSLGERKVLPPDEPGGEYKVVSEGDIRVDVCSAFEVFPDPLAKNWEELRYLIHAKIRPLEYFKSRYENGSLVKEEDCWLSSLQYELRINSFNTQAGNTGSSTMQTKNSAIEISYYEKPSKEHPMGRHIIQANGVLLKDDILPIDEIPFVKFDDIKVAGKFYSEAVITHLRPLQDQINRVKNMRAQWTNRLLAGKYMAARGHGLAAESLNDQSGEVLLFDPVPSASDPVAMQVPVIPQYAYTEEEVLTLDINDTSGINEASRGQMPSASIPAIGMQLLVEQDDTRIGVETESHEYSYADLGRILLKFTGEYYQTPRVLKMAGKNMEWTTKNFLGEDLRDNFDVFVIKGSTLPGSKVLKRQEIINLHQQGYFGNPQDPVVLQNVLSMLEFGDEFKPWKKRALVDASIQRGLDTIERLTEKPAVSEFDNHELWIQEFDEYRLSEKYRRMTEEQQGLVLEVMNEHLDLLQEKMMPSENPDTDPNFKQTDAALQEEEKLMNEAPPEVLNEQPILSEGI